MDTTIVEHPNATLFRKGYEAFDTGDIDFLRATLAEDVTWHSSGTGRLAGDRRGRDEVLLYFAELAQATDGSFKLDVHDIVANDEHAVAMVTAHWEFEGQPYEDKGVQVVHLKDGKVTESWFFDWSDTFDRQFA